MAYTTAQPPPPAEGPEDVPADAPETGQPYPRAGPFPVTASVGCVRALAPDTFRKQGYNEPRLRAIR